MLHIDFETRGVVDLKTRGLDAYSRDQHTGIWCLGFAFDDEPVDVIEQRHLAGGSPFLQRVLNHVAAGGQCVAHNAQFELVIWNLIAAPRFGWPRLHIRQMRCTMAASYAMALPGGLDNAAAALGIQHEKDKEGYRLMLQMARPKLVHPDGTPVWWDDPARLERLYEYCKQDIVVERELLKRLVPLSDYEQRVWELDQRINMRGIFLDLRAIQRALAVVEVEKKNLDSEMRKVTDHEVKTCSEVVKLAGWLNKKGVPIEGVAKDDVLDALALADLPPEAEQALLIRQEAAKTSTSKLETALERVGPDGNLRYTLQYSGASTTRWAARGMQLHNLMRPKLKQPEIERVFAVLDRVEDPVLTASILHSVFGPPMDVLASCMRGNLVAHPEHELLAADYRNIEGRGLAWLAGEDWKTEAFRAFDDGTGPDMYKLSYARSFGKSIEDVTEEERQIGKVEELSLGYQGGQGAFQQMAKNYNVRLPSWRVQIVVDNWREAHPKTRQYWYDVEEAAMLAILNPGQIFTAGPRSREVAFKVSGSFLWCRVPSGGVLCYPYPCIKSRPVPWGGVKDCVHYKTVGSKSRKWEETHSYGGKFVENITQKVARDVLVGGMLRVEAGGYPIKLHVHDEIVAERRIGEGSLDEFERLCSVIDPWAKGFPIIAKGWRGKRYRKG